MDEYSCPECPHIDDIYDCECDWCKWEREKWGHDIPEEESEYKCSGADYHLPNCGGECGYAD